MVPNFYFTKFNIGPIVIQAWGLFVALGILLSVFILAKRSKKEILSKELIIDLAFWLILSGIIGGRLFHVLFYDPIYYFVNPVDIIKIWQGGMSSFGGIVGAVIAFFLYLKIKKIKAEKWIQIADQLSFAALFGWIVGRLGCVAIHDHPGKLSDAWFAWQLNSGVRLEMAMLEIVFLLPLAVVFYIFRNQTKQKGWFTVALFGYYAVLRFVLDFFRATDLPGSDTRYFGLTPAQYFCLMIVFVFLLKLKKYFLKINNF